MKHFLLENKLTLWITILSLFGVAMLALFPQVAFAQDTIEGILFFVISNLTGWLLWVGGSLLDYGINTFVINFGSIYNSGGVGLAVDQLWVLVRDLFNILFIFGLVYIGFKMILNSDDSQTKKTLVSLIIAALLINFSLFITKFVVDFTNILASEIAVAGFDTIGDDLDGNPTSVRVGDTFFRLMGISTINFSGENAPGLDGDGAAPWSYIFGIGIINIIGAFAFGVGGIMLIIRFIALSVYMVLSPFMFLGWIFPGFKNMSDKYWSGFLKQSFYAPVYIIMIFFAASILDNFFGDGVGAGGSAQGGGLGNLTQQNSDVFNPTGTVSEIAANFAGGLGPFILSAGFLIAAVQVAGKLASDGSGVMAKVSNGVNSRVRGAVRRPLAAYGAVGSYAARGVGRGAGGYMARGINEGSEVSRRQLNRVTAWAGNKGAIGRAAARGLDSTVGAGLDRGTRASVLGSETIDQQRERIARQNNSFNQNGDEFDREKTLREERKKLKEEEAKLAPGNTLTPDERRDVRKKIDEANTKIGGVVGKMSTAELRRLSENVRNSPEILGKLSAEQIKALGETGDFTRQQKKDMGAGRETARFAGFEKVLNDVGSEAEELADAMEGLAKMVSRLSNEELSNFSFERLNTEAIASQLSEKQLETLKDSGKISIEQYDKISATRSKGIENIISKGRVDIQNKDAKNKFDGTTTAATPLTGDVLKKQREKYIKSNTETIGKLPLETFFDRKTGTLTEVGNNMTVDMMKAIARAANQGKSEMTADERTDLAGAIKFYKQNDPRMAAYITSKKAKEDFFNE